MQASTSKHLTDPQHRLIADILTELDHILPGQAPILDFVHHNTLHGFQHLPFEQALVEFEALTGINGYLPEQQYRIFYQQNRITEHDINAALAKHTDLNPEQGVCVLNARTITQQELFKLALLFDFEAISASQLQWQINELAALTSIQPDVPALVSAQLISESASPDHAITSLRTHILTRLELQSTALHPEALIDLSIEHAEQWLSQYQEQAHKQLQLETDALEDLFSQLGDQLTLRELIQQLTGIDVLDSVRPQLIRICASALDEGVAAWQSPNRHHLGFFGAWRANINYDANPFLHELPDWQLIISELPDTALETILLQLNRLEIPQNHWSGYLQRLSLDLPGWSGMINWRQQHPHYNAQNNAHPSLADYLAIRLTLDHLWLNQICMDTWKINANLSALRAYFRKNIAEFTVRYTVYQQQLPEYLTQLAETLITQADSDRQNRSDWQRLADLIKTWQCSPLSSQNVSLSRHNEGWRLFRLCQHLGLTPTQQQALTKADLLAMLNVLDAFNSIERSKIWLTAYEINYRNSLFQTLRANEGRGRWPTRDQRPEAQIIFCMDDREEGFRRHLEEFNPALETFGAAGFFGIAMNYQGLDDAYPSALCPIVVTPAHNVIEVADTTQAKDLQHYQSVRHLQKGFANTLYHRLRRNLLVSNPIINAIAPFTLLNLLTKSLSPLRQGQLLSALTQHLTPPLSTQLQVNAVDQTSTASPTHPQTGFTDQEQADRIAGLLKNIGLTQQFSTLIILMGHGSISQNNPHLAAYDCGACSGRHGGPNGRAFAAMANRPEVRQRLATQGIHIPSDTWFIGAEHNTCNEAITWYDLSLIPPARQGDLSKLQHALAHAQRLSAHERCRRLASAPKNPTPQAALAHIQERAVDFSQARPELGHATNAAALVGRRSLTQGAFFDRRLFLISYDPTQDAEGKILENILLAVGPVGAGINLEYYFSTVNNERLGCGSKVPHNVTGFFGVMEGTSSDLRTGLPQQMVEVHEAMRLQLIVEAKTSVLERIYAEQPSLQELIAGGWLHLSAKDPDSEAIHVFERGIGFVRWKDTPLTPQPIGENSPDCYKDQSLPVSPMLIKQPEHRTANHG